MIASNPHTIAATDLPFISAMVKELGAPLLIFDTETTGLQRPVGIVEFAALSIGPDGSTQTFNWMINPEQKIEPGASKVHGIKESDVASSPTFDFYLPKIKSLFSTHIVCGYNIKSYDLPVVKGLGNRYGDKVNTPRVLDLMGLYKSIESTEKGGLIGSAKRHNLNIGEAHRALGDVITTANLLEYLVLKHGYVKITKFTTPGYRKQELSSEQTDQLIKRAVQANSSGNNTKVTKKQRAIDGILSVLNDKGQFSLADEVKILEANPDFTPATVSFAISELMARAVIAPEQVADPGQVDMISSVLIEAIERCSRPHLKEIRKHAMDLLGNTGEEIDYVQLRAAIYMHPHSRQAMARKGFDFPFSLAENINKPSRFATVF